MSAPRDSRWESDIVTVHATRRMMRQIAALVESVLVDESPNVTPERAAWFSEALATLRGAL